MQKSYGALLINMPQTCHYLKTEVKLLRTGDPYWTPYYQTKRNMQEDMRYAKKSLKQNLSMLNVPSLTNYNATVF